MSEPNGAAKEGAPNEASDHSLLRRIRDGSQDAAGELYFRYAHRLIALARANSSPELAQQVDSEEMVQSIFGSFFRGAQQGCYDIPVGEELWKLFLVIALNKIRSKATFHHAGKRDSRLTKSGEELDERALDQGSNEIAIKELEMTIDEAMANMPDYYRTMVTLRIEGYTVEEIAQQSGRSKRTVERILQEVRRTLSHVLIEQ